MSSQSYTEFSLCLSVEEAQTTRQPLQPLYSSSGQIDGSDMGKSGLKQEETSEFPPVCGPFYIFSLAVRIVIQVMKTFATFDVI